MQSAVLLSVSGTTVRADGRVIPPGNLRGGVRVKAMTGLVRGGWIETQ